MQGELHKWRLRDAYSNDLILPQLGGRLAIHSAIDSIDRPTASLVAAENSQNCNHMMMNLVFCIFYFFNLSNK